MITVPVSGPLALEQLDRHLAADELTTARDLTRAVRDQQPGWLPGFEGEIAVREVELAFLAYDAIAGRTVARSYLDRHRTEDGILRLVALTGRLAERGRPAEARLLHDEISATPPPRRGWPPHCAPLTCRTTRRR